MYCVLLLPAVDRLINDYRAYTRVKIMFHIHPRLCSYSVSNFLDWSPYISFKNSWLRDFGLKSKHSPFGNQFSSSHNLYSWWSADVVRRQLMLVTLGTKSVNSYLPSKQKYLSQMTLFWALLHWENKTYKLKRSIDVFKMWVGEIKIWDDDFKYYNDEIIVYSHWTDYVVCGWNEWCY